MAEDLRTCSGICKEADRNSEDMKVLSDLWEYVILNKKKYALVELKFMIEHIQSYVKEIAKSDARLFHQYLNRL